MPWDQRWRNVFRPDRLSEELENEFQYHLAETVDRLVDGGMPEKEAWLEARRRLGNYSVQKEKTRDMNIAAWLDTTRADLFYGLRQLRLNPGFASIAVLSLALGIGANAAIFQLVNAIRLKTLPVHNPEELVSIDYEKGSHRGGSWSTRSAVFTYRQWEEIRMQQHAFAGVIAWSAARFNLTHGGEPRFAEGLYVDGDFFRQLGVGAVLGRTLTPQDEAGSCRAGAVLSYGFWQSEFGGDDGILGHTISLDGTQVPVIGVTGPAFFGVEVGNRYDLAIPLCTDALLANDKKGRRPGLTQWWLSIIGRLKPGETIQSATAHLHALSPGIMRATLPPDYRPDVAKQFLKNQIGAKDAGTGISGLRKDYERPLWLLLATAGLVLLIACANLANLLLARAAVREPEIAVRLAIGASRWRLVRQLLAESLLLAISGALLGGVLALALSRALVLFISSKDNPLFVDLAMDWRMLGFMGALAVLTCLLFGLLPALRATYLSPASAMRTGVRSVTAGKDRFSIRRALVATQVALSLVLLFGALLFVRNLRNLLTIDAGFRPEGVLVVGVDFGKADYTDKQKFSIHRQLAERFSAIPGVLSTAQVGFTPVGGSGWDNLIGPDAMPAAGSGKQAFLNRAGTGYFATMGTRVIAGREFNDHDTLASPHVAIVNEMFARKFFGGANPVGHSFHVEAPAGKPEPLFQIIGMVQNTKYYELREDFKPLAFFPVLQDEHPGSGTTFVLRTKGAPGTVISNAKSAVAATNPSFGVQPGAFSTQLQESLLRERLMATLSGGFGLLAGVLATLGLYGVISYMVARRRNEIGIRVALGADRPRVIRLVLSEAVLLLGIGLAAGIVLALWAGRAASTLLFGLEAYDLVSLLSASALLAVIALVASYVPARRAAAFDPIAALRNE